MKLLLIRRLNQAIPHDFTRTETKGCTHLCPDVIVPVLAETTQECLGTEKPSAIKEIRAIKFINFTEKTPQHLQPTCTRSKECFTPVTQHHISPKTHPESPLCFQHRNRRLHTDLPPDHRDLPFFLFKVMMPEGRSMLQNIRCNPTASPGRSNWSIPLKARSLLPVPRDAPSTRCSGAETVESLH